MRATVPRQHRGNRTQGAAHRDSPGESSTTEGISLPERPELRKAWGFTPLVLILCVVAIFLAGVIAMIVALST